MKKTVPILSNAELNDSSRLTDEMFLSHVNFDVPGLEPAGAAYERGDVAAAKAAVVAHFRARVRPVWPRYMVHSAWLRSSGRGPVVERADLFLEGKMKVCWFPFPVIPFAGDDDVARHAGRHTFVPDLLTAYDETRNEQYLIRMMERMEQAVRVQPFRLRPDFDNRFPYWAPGHDPMTDGCVMQRWFDVLQHPVFRDRSALTDEFRWWMLRWMWFQSVQFLRYEGARYRDDNHHLFEYGVAPFNVGFNFPEFRHFDRLARTGLSIVRRHLDRTVFADGTQGEHSVPYQQFILTDFAVVYAQAKANGVEPFTKTQLVRMRGWCEFQCWATKPDGRLCELGDHVPPDLSYFLADHAGLWPSGFVKWAAARLGYPKVKPAQHLESAWKRTRAKPATETSKVFPDGGYVVMRDGWSKDGLYMLVSTPGAKVLRKAHSHLDPMHFVLHAFGRTLIGDPATIYYSYRPDRSTMKRGYHYGMGSHNCLIQNDDELEPHRALGSFCVYGVETPVVTIRRAALGRRLDFIDMHYDGYNRRRWCPSCTRSHDDANRHRRVLLFLKDAGWVFVDTVNICPDDIRHHDYDQLLHFAPDTEVLADARRATIHTMNRDANVLVVASPSPRPAVSVEPDPYMVATDFPGGARPPVVGHIRRKKTFSPQFAFAVLPFRGSVVPEARMEQADVPSGMFLTLRRGADVDVIWVRLGATRGDAVHDGIETDARVAVVRSRGGRLREAMLIDGKKLVIDGKPVPQGKMESLSSSKP